MGHYDKYYKEQDRINTADKNNQMAEQIAKIRIEIIESLPLNISFKGYYPKLVNKLVNKLAACRVNGFKNNELDDLLTEIVKHLHK